MSAGRALALAALAAALLVPHAAADAAQVIYRQRLALPVAGDDIAYGQCVTADPHTREVFVCDPRTNRILIFDREGHFDFQIVGGQEITSPEDIAVDPDGLLLLLANRMQRRSVVELDFDGQFRREVALVGLPADAAPPDLVSIAISARGDRFFAVDAANASLWVVDRGGLVLAGADLRADLEPEAKVDFSVGHVDAYGERVVVALPMAGRVLIYSLDGEAQGYVGVFGAGPCQLGHVAAAALDREGHMLVLDTQRMVVSRWRIEGNRCLSEHIGLGNAPGYLYFPNDLSLDPDGRLYIAQTAMGRVQVYEGLGAAPAPPRAAD